MMSELLAHWLSPLAIERVRLVAAVTATVLALAFLAVIVCIV
jgi:hypothetical protein